MRADCLLFPLNFLVCFFRLYRERVLYSILFFSLEVRFAILISHPDPIVGTGRKGGEKKHV